MSMCSCGRTVGTCHHKRTKSTNVNTVQRNVEKKSKAKTKELSRFDVLLAKAKAK